MAIMKNWNPYTDFVEKDDPLYGNGILTPFSSKFILLGVMLAAKGKNALTYTECKTIEAVGVLQTMSLAQNKNVQQLFEIGSDKEMLIPGRTFRNLNLGRALINGRNLLHRIYGNDSSVEYWDSAASNDIALNLGSKVFDRPIGLTIMFYKPGVKEGSVSEEIAASFALERCIINAHTIATNAGDVIVMENVTMTPAEIKPIPATSLLYT